MAFTSHSSLPLRSCWSKKTSRFNMLPAILVVTDKHWWWSNSDSPLRMFMGNGISRFELGGRLSINSIVMQLQLLSQGKNTATCRKLLANSKWPAPGCNEELLRSMLTLVVRWFTGENSRIICKPKLHQQLQEKEHHLNVSTESPRNPKKSAMAKMFPPSQKKR